MNKHRKHAIFVVLFLLLSVTAYRMVFSRTNLIRAQETNTLSPTPSIDISQTILDIPKINPETLRDPSAFKLDQQIKQATRELFQTTDSSMRENKAEYRKTLMKQAIKKYPHVFLGNSLTSFQTSPFEQSIQQYFEKSITLSGVELGVTHYDDFKDYKNSSFEYSLQNLQEHKRFNFYPSGEFDGHISGTILNVNGVALDDDVSARVAGAPQGGGENNDPVITNVEILKEASPDALGPQKTVLILVYPKGIDPASLPSKEKVFNNIFKGKVQVFFKEASYGKTWFDEENSHVYGWYEVGADAIGDQINSHDIIKQTDPDIDFSQYGRVMIGGWQSYGAHASVGKYTFDTQDGSVKASVSIVNIEYPKNLNIEDGTNFLVVAHETGHTYGVHHANSWDCNQGGLEGNCIRKEYGNIFDVMGSGSLRHFNGYFKEVFRWLNKPVINITSSGKYSLQPLETSEAVVAKISRPGVSNFPIYYLETRTPIGFDDDTNLAVKDVIRGVHINWVNLPLVTRFLTLNPRPTKQIEPLKRGQSFRDEKGGLIITNIDDTTVDVEMAELPACKYKNNFDTKIRDIYAYDYNTEVVFKSEIVCNNISCVLKRKKPTKVFVTFVLDIKNDNEYLCPAGYLRILLESPWKADLSLTQKTLTIPSQNWSGEFGLVAFIPSETPTGVYKLNVFMKSLDTGQMIFSTAREIQIIDEFQTLEGDLNNDQKVDIFDLVTVAKDFGKKGEGFAGDADKNNIVDIFDLVIVAKNFGKKL